MIRTHIGLQKLLAEIGKRLGYQASTEYKTEDGRIDVIWRNQKEFITFEIDLQGDKVVSNLIKCMNSKPTKHIHIVRGNKEAREIEKISTIKPIVLEELEKEKLLGLKEKDEKRYVQELFSIIGLKSATTVELKRELCARNGFCLRTADRIITKCLNRNILVPLDKRLRNNVVMLNRKFLTKER